MPSKIAWKLFHSRWNITREPTKRPRILFLADRNVLANQAYNSFSAFDADALIRITPEEIRKHGRMPKNASVFFSIFQTFMRGETEDDEDEIPEVVTIDDPNAKYRDYPQDFFDLIIVDECHHIDSRNVDAFG